MGTPLMRTSSVWGTPRAFFWKSVSVARHTWGKQLCVCVVGCSDGKFVLPLARLGIHVDAFDVDPVALFGGTKAFPRRPLAVPAVRYRPGMEHEAAPQFPIVERPILGLAGRLAAEGLRSSVHFEVRDVFRDPPPHQYYLVFTSCSIQYRCNRDLDPEGMLHTLMSAVQPGGYLSMEYMMPLEDGDSRKASHFFRPRSMRLRFGSSWQVMFLREQRSPRFEAAHVDRPADHFHRLGQILARRSP